MKARVEGTVLLDVVVMDDGTVGDVAVARPLDEGLDAEAVSAMKQWQFRPGTRDRKPVAVMCELRFTLK
jgi:TonB family protein